MLGQLEEAVKRLNQFSADVSHDLRTSITVMLATAQLALNHDRTVDEYREDLSRIVAECRTAATLLDSLLPLVRSKNFLNEMSTRQMNHRGKGEQCHSGNKHFDFDRGSRLHWLRASVAHGEPFIARRVLRFLRTAHLQRCFGFTKT